MDLSYTFLIFSLLLLLLLLIKFNIHGRGANVRLPPGPWKLPIIGSLHHLLGPLPHRSLAALSKQYGPVMLLKLGEVDTLIISSPTAAAEIMKTQDVSFATRPMILAANITLYKGKGLIFAPYGTYWRELRKMSIAELLSARRVQSFRSIREEEALNLVRSVASLANTKCSTVNLSRKLMRLTNDIAARAIIGSKCEYQEEFLRVLSAGLEAAGGFNMVDLFPSSSFIRLFSSMVLKLQGLHGEMDSIIDRIIREHKERKTTDTQAEQDLVDVLLRIQEDGSLPFPLTDGSVKAIILDLFGAGSETSATLLEWAMSELMRNPTVMRRAQVEVREIVRGKEVTEDNISQMNYLPLVIKETLRLHPPLPLLLPRECQEARGVLGYLVPAKTRVLVNAWALGRDPQYWDDADEFKPERFEGGAVDFKGTNFEFIPFGAGRRMCPGIAFGLVNVELPLACLLYYFDWELPAADDAEMKPKQELDMAEVFSLTVRRKSELRLRAIPCIPCPPMA